MPFGALDRPALGISILKPIIAKAGLTCDIAYLMAEFAEFVGFDAYRWISSELPYTAYAGDWTFAEALHGSRPDADALYVNQILRGEWRLSDETIARVLRIRCFVEPFLRHCLRRVRWQDYDVVGFTSTFEQNIASLALARVVKASHPRIVTVFGGANWEGDMGVELHASFPFVDYACSGEADESFPALLARLDQGRSGEGIPGVVHRQGNRSVSPRLAAPVRDLDRQPMPDFTDYFAALRHTGADRATTPILLCETSRGCWWGAKSHCTFCGLNGGTMSFRSKSPDRALAEFQYLTTTWGIDFVEIVDNILDMKYFETVLAELATQRLPIRLFYEVKANLRRHHVQRLREAGVVRIQPGIESLSDHILRLMGKGTTALRNIQLLKWCKEYGITVDWNILYGFPGETHEDYGRMLGLLRMIRYLDPPTGCGPVRLDRFSPYFENPDAYGIVNVRPLAAYRYLYPFERERVARIAYSFDFEQVPGQPHDHFASQVVDFVAEWVRDPEPGGLWQVSAGKGAIVLVDTRRGQSAQIHLTGLDGAIYEFCDEVRPLNVIAKFVQDACQGSAFSDKMLTESLDSLVQNGLMLSDGGIYLSLAVRAKETRNFATMCSFTPA